MDKWYKISNSEKITAYNIISEKINLPPYAVEKDWWVVQTLSLLFSLNIAEYMVFKGGTSLSKAWGLIERFSEDIDLAVDRSFFGFEGELKKKQRTKLRKASLLYIIETLYPEIQKKFMENGITDVNIEFEEIITSNQDPVILNIFYPNVIDYPGNLKPIIQIEIGCRSLSEPHEAREIISLVDEHYPDAPFAQSSIRIPTVVPTRTFLEKIFLLHEEFQRPDEKIRVNRLSRHLYDIYQIGRTEFAERALEDKNLYETIVKHRYNFTKLGRVNYNLHNPCSINFLPPENVLKEWQSDYKTMQEQMIHGESPNFESLIIYLTNLQKRINSINWNLETSFPEPAK